MTGEVLMVETPVGPGRITVSRPERVWGVLALGHGAGGMSWSADILAVADLAVSLGYLVGLVDQPWRVAGKKVASAPARLDHAWPALVTALLGVEGASGPLVVAGRSAGARVACRTAGDLGAAGVLALSFPLHPPGHPEKSRADEARLPHGHGIPLLVIQGERDPFGTPGEVRAALAEAGRVAATAGTHALTDPEGVADRAGALLREVLG